MSLIRFCFGMFSFLLVVFPLAASSANCQTPEAPTIQAAAKAETLPKAWFGSWQGTVSSTSASGAETKFDMQLNVQPTEDAGKFTWSMTYSGEQGKSQREYLLIAEPSQPGQFVIDEQNGIRITAVLLGDTLSSHFSIGGQTLWNTYRLVQDNGTSVVHFELITAAQNDATTSGGQAGVPKVESLKASARQFGVLRRVAAEPALATSKTAASTTASPAGPTWRKLNTEAYRGKQDDIYFVNERVGWYANGAGKIFHTSDGGETWELQLEKPGTYFRCLAFLDEKHGFAGNIGPDYFPNVTDSVPLYETLDGGKTWKAVTAMDGPPVVGLCAIQILREPFINAGKLETRTRIIGVGRVGGPTAMIVSDDEGKSWQQIKLPAEAAMALDVHFFNRNEGLLASATSTDVSQSNALILSTSDGGKSWQPVWKSDRPFELTWKMSFPSRQVGYVTVQSYNPDPTASQRYVAKTEDGGKSWNELPLVDDARVREFGIAFANESVGWVGAMPGGFQTTDGGKTWTPISMGNAVNKIRLIETEAGLVGFAIGVQVHRLDLPRTQLESLTATKASATLSTSRDGMPDGMPAGARKTEGADADAIRQCLAQQAEAWNRGDIDEFMETYWKSEELTFSSGGSVTRGWQATIERYKSRYATPEQRGQLKFSDLEVSLIGPDAALVLGRWHLTRDAGNVGGNFSLVWRKLEGRWVIIHDHTSADAKE